MGKYGQRNIVSTDLEKYNICLLGESGIGKTSLMVETCEKLFGKDGYMIMNAGKEEGIDCIDDASYENVPNFKVFDDFTNDIISNKGTDYPNLKVIVTDTLDQLFEIVEPEVIRRWNVEGLNKKDFVKAKTINQGWGGFGRGEDKAIEIILERMWELKKVGVAFWSCGHVKTREILDPITNQTYTSLSTNMMQKYFNGIKTKMHVVGIACIDREIIKEKTGRKNIVTKEDITINKISSESRKIIFRDDNYGVDSKSRFANIIDEIPLNADEFIKALKDAILKAKKNDSPIKEKVKKEIKEVIKKEIKEEIDLIEDDIVENEDIFQEEIEENIVENGYPEDLKDVINKMFKECKDADLKSEIRNIIKEHGKLIDVPYNDLKIIYDKLK